MKPKNVSLTEQEANALLEIIDLAVKAHGLALAPTALSLAQKIQAAFQPKEPTRG